MSATQNRKRFRRIANQARRHPGRLGLRPWRVFASAGTWSGSAAGDGTETLTEVEILEQGQPPKVQAVSEERVALGEVDRGDYEIGPITQIVGTAWATLLGSGTSAGDTFRIRLLHDETGDNVHCVVKHVGKTRALHTMIRCAPVKAE